MHFVVSVAMNSHTLSLNVSTGFVLHLNAAVHVTVLVAEALKVSYAPSFFPYFISPFSSCWFASDESFFVT